MSPPPTKRRRLLEAGKIRGLSHQSLLRRVAEPKPPHPGQSLGEGGQGVSARSRDGIRAARISHVLDGEDDPDDPEDRVTRRQLQQSVQEEAEGLFDAIELNAGGVEFSWRVCLPSKFLPRLLSDPSGRWAQIFHECMRKHPCSRHAPWRLLLYHDDVGGEGPNASAPSALLPGGGRGRTLQ